MLFGHLIETLVHCQNIECFPLEFEQTKPVDVFVFVYFVPPVLENLNKALTIERKSSEISQSQKCLEDNGRVPHCAIVVL